MKVLLVEAVWRILVESQNVQLSKSSHPNWHTGINSENRASCVNITLPFLMVWPQYWENCTFVLWTLRFRLRLWHSPWQHTMSFFSLCDGLWEHLLKDSQRLWMEASAESLICPAKSLHLKLLRHTHIPPTWSPAWSVPQVVFHGHTLSHTARACSVVWDCISIFLDSNHW